MSSAETKGELAPLEEILSVGEEVLNGEQLPALLASGVQVVAYDGFEPSGRLTISQTLMRTINTNKLTKHGIKFKFWVADWFAMMNHKLGGDLKRIRKAGELMILVWKLCGMNMENVEFIWASEEINHHPQEYWERVIDVATRMNLNRVLKCTPILGRKTGLETEEVRELRRENLKLKKELLEAKLTTGGAAAELTAEIQQAEKKEESQVESPMSASHIFYACMQCADIFHLGVHICSLGMDQRKVNAMALEYCDKIKRKYKPIILSHHMLMGLDGSDKMSKSNPDNAIFMDDPPGEINRKIKKAFCVPGEVKGNPIIEYCQYLIFPLLGHLEVKRKEKNGGNLTFGSISELKESYSNLELHPGDLKPAVANALNQLVEPVRQHFAENAEARKLLEQVQKYRS